MSSVRVKENEPFDVALRRFKRMIEKTGVPFTSFPSALGSLVLKDKNVVGIAGTHGKTTTTYFMTQLLEKLNQL